MFKRRIGSVVHARTYWPQCEELLLKAITFNLMLISAFIGFLQSRSGVLLSNAAQAGGAAQPALPKAEGEQYEYLAGWWKEHAAKAVLRDPWLKALEKQKVD